MIENEEQRDNSYYFPFNIHWLDSSYQQTCLPNSPWRKVKFVFKNFCLKCMKLDSG